MGLLVALVWTGCYSDDEEPVEDPFPSVETVTLGADVQSAEPAVVMRFTNGSTLDTEIYTALNVLANERLDLGDLLMRGGLPKDNAGVEIVPAVPNIAGSSPEQVAQLVAGGPTNAADAVDACGNPMVAAFITPDMAQHVGLGTGADVFPGGCDGPDCDTLQWGTIEVVPSAVRFDGLMDMVFNVHSDPISGAPALFGHLLGFMLTGVDPGFTEVPLVLSVDKAQLLMFNMWQQQKVYEHQGVGTRQVMAMPSVGRTVERAAELLLTLGPRSEAECLDTWTTEVGGTPPYGCEPGLPLLIDRTAPAGAELYSTYLRDGTDPSAIESVKNILEYQLQASLACPAPGIGHNVWVKEGPVELFLCPTGDLDLCLAAEDMEEYACRPVQQTLGVTFPVSQTEAIELAAQQVPLVLRSFQAYLDNLLVDDDSGLVGTTNPLDDPPLPFAGANVVLEITVDADTVIYLREDDLARVETLSGPTGADLVWPEAIVDSHCEEEPAFRFDVGAQWDPGVYTLEIPWLNDDADFTISVTSVPSWVF